MPDPEGDLGFTVVDRRHRGGGEEPEVLPEALPETPPTRPSPGAPPAEPPSTPGGGPRADLASFCVMLYSDALVHLGHVPDPVTGQRHQDLDQARFTIDLLGMIQEKTEGNRTPEESAVLSEVLTNLRMAFVRASRLP